MARAEVEVMLPNGQRAGETLKQLRHQAAALNKEISGLKPGTDEFVKASASLNQVKGRMEDIDKQVKGTTVASSKMKDEFFKIIPFGDQLSVVTGRMGDMKGGIGGLISGFGGLRGAIAATGFGLLLIVLGALFNWLSKLESVTNMLKGAWDGLNSAVGVFFKSIQDRNLEGLGSRMVDAAKKAYQLVQAFDELEDKQRGINLLNAVTEKQVDELLLRSKNVSLSYRERIELLDQADKIEKEQYQRRLEYAAAYLKTVNEEVAEARKKGKVEDDLADKQNDARIAFIKVQNESINLQEKITNRREQLMDKEAAAVEKVRAAEQKRRDELKKQDQDESKLIAQREQINAANEENRIQAGLKRRQAEMQAKLAQEVEILRQREANEKAHTDTLLALERAKRQMMAESLSVFNEGVNSTIQLLAADEAARKKNANLIKFFEAGRVTVNGIAEISEIAKTFAALGPAGQVLAAFRIAFAAARTFAGVRRIQSTRFEQGGAVLRGPSHAQGGIPIEAEGEEIILTKGVWRSPALRAMASAINVAGGGRQLAAVGWPTNPYGSGSPGRVPDVIDYEKLGEVIERKMEGKIYQVQVNNNVQDTARGLNTLNRLQSMADL